MTTPSNTRLLGSSNWTKGSSDYSPTSTDTPFATPATRATSIAPSTFSRSGAGNRRAKQLLLSSTSSIDGTRHNDTQASPTPIGSRSSTPAPHDGSGTGNNDIGAKSNNARQRNQLPQPASTPTSVASSTAAMTPATPSEPGKDPSDDFYAKAQAMGLRLSREDIERTRAGMAAFLKAERLPSTSTQPGVKPTNIDEKAASSGSSDKVAGRQAYHQTPTPAPTTKSGGSSDVLGASAPLKPNSAQLGTSATRFAAGPSWSRGASSPMLSFFTAMVAPTLLPGSSSKIRASLDEISSAEEKRRLKIKRAKLREKRERQRALAQQHLRTPNSTILLQSSPEGRDSCSFETPPALRSASDAAKHNSSGSGQSRKRVGLGLDFEDSDDNASPLPSTPPEMKQSHFSSGGPRSRTVSFDTSSPGDVLSQPMRHCASLDDLSRRAWVSPRGKLHLMRSAVDPEGVFPSPEIEADDYGVYETDEANDAVAVTATGVPSDGWGAKHRRESSGCLSGTDALNSGMGRLGILDQVMSQQTSPRRLYKEAKRREKSEKANRQMVDHERAEQAAQQIAELAAQAQLQEAEAAKAADAANAIKASNSDYNHAGISTPSAARRRRLQSGVFGMATPLEASVSRGMRYLHGMTSPRNGYGHTRMSTREHYDFVMHDISPSQSGFDSLDSICNISNTPGPITFSASWDAEPLSAMCSNHDSGGGNRVGGQRSAPASATPFQSSVFTEEGGPELYGVSPSVAGLGQARQIGLQSSQSKLLRPSSGGLAVMSPLSGRLIPSMQTRISDLDFDEDPTTAEDYIDSLPGMGQGSGFNPKRGLLFGASPPSSSTGSRSSALDATLAQSITSRGLGMMGASPERAGLSLGTRLAFASPRTVLLRAHSGSSIETSALRRLDESPRQDATLVRKRKASRDARVRLPWSDKVAFDGFDTISPADVFGSAVPRTGSGSLSQPKSLPLPEPVKVGHHGMQGEVFSDDEVVEADYTSDVELSARKKHVVDRRARSHSPQYPLKQAEPAMSVIRDGFAYPAVQLDYGASAESFGGNAHAGAGQPGPGAPAHDQSADSLGVEKARPVVHSASAKKPMAKAKGAAARTEVARAVNASGRNFDQMALQSPSAQNGDEIGWDQPDGSRLVKLVSEELQAALESGTLDQEPPMRYYLLPPGFGQSKSKPSSVSYAGLIGQAIKASSDMRLSLAEVYAWISTTYPFFEKGDRGWQNSIRHNLSLNKSFIKIEREANMPGKGGWWGIQPGHEDRFQNGMYNASGHKAEAARSKTASKPSSEKKDVSARVAPQPSSSSQSTPVLATDVPLPAVADDAALTSAPANGGQRRGNKVLKKKAASQRKKTSLSTQADKGGASSDDGDVPLRMAGVRPPKRVKVAVATVAAGAAVTQATRLPLAETQVQLEGHRATGMPLDSTTPVRPQNSVYASSVADSQHNRGAPMLTDSASSPPSSPFTLMPPPTVQMTADHSALKRKLASSHGDGQYGYSTGYSPSPYGVGASPLSSGRGNPYRTMRNSALSGAFSFSGPTHGGEASGGSPLRRAGKAYVNGNVLSASPKRLWSMSSPVSSLRGSVKSAGASASNARSGGEDASTSLLPFTSANAGALSKSPNSSARMAALAHSPIRGSPLRHASSSFNGSPGRSVAGSSSMQMHLGMGGSGASSLTPFGHGLGMGMGGLGNTPGRKSTHPARYGSALSPMRRSLMSSSQMHGHAMSQQQQSHLDELFHHQEHQYAAQQQQQQQQQQMGRFGDMVAEDASSEGPTASPLRMMWNTIQAAGGVQAFTNGYQASHQQ